MTVATPRAGESGPPEAAAVYALGSNEDESTRLQRQAEELRPEAAALLGQIGLKPGQSAIDLGCGRPRAGRAEVIEADARRTGLPTASFDLVHARTLLVTIPEPAEVLAEMVLGLGPPGAVGWPARNPTPNTRSATRAARLDAAARALPDQLRPQRRRPAHRPPARRAVPGGGIAGRSGPGAGPRLPGRAHPPHRAGRPGAQPAPDDRRAGPSRRARAHRGGPGGPGTEAPDYIAR